MHTAATTRAGASIRAFALSVGLAAMLGGAGPGVSAELKDPLSPLTSRRSLNPLFRTQLFAGPSGAASEANDKERPPRLPNKAAGFDCMVTVGDSAEERGYFLIDPAPDAKSLTLFLLSPIGAESDKPGKTEGNSLDLGPEDRTFALARIDSGVCEPFKATVK
jgi:hypothetical protein